METTGPFTQVLESMMPLIQIAVVLWAAETILTMLIRDYPDDAYKGASQVQEEERAGEAPP